MMTSLGGLAAAVGQSRMKKTIQTTLHVVVVAIATKKMTTADGLTLADADVTAKAVTAKAVTTKMNAQPVAGVAEAEVKMMIPIAGPADLAVEVDRADATMLVTRNRVLHVDEVVIKVVTGMTKRKKPSLVADAAAVKIMETTKIPIRREQDEETARGVEGVGGQIGNQRPLNRIATKTISLMM